MSETIDFEEIKSNMLKLKNCSGHGFEKRDNKMYPYICSYCQGYVDELFVLAYRQGINHGIDTVESKSKKTL